MLSRQGSEGLMLSFLYLLFYGIRLFRAGIVLEFAMCASGGFGLHSFWFRTSVVELRAEDLAA